MENTRIGLSIKNVSANSHIIEINVISHMDMEYMIVDKKDCLQVINLTKDRLEVELLTEQIKKIRIKNTNQ